MQSWVWQGLIRKQLKTSAQQCVGESAYASIWQ
jgi:hypothetical protein